MDPGATTGQRTSFDLFNPQEPGNPFARVKVTNTLRGEQPGDQPVWTLEKDSDPPSGSTVAPDTSITYTLTVTNRSVTTALPAGVVITDDLRDVLDHARFVGIRAGTPAERCSRAPGWCGPSLRSGRAGRSSSATPCTSTPTPCGVTLRNSVTGVGDVAPSTTDCRQSVAPAVVTAKASQVCDEHDPPHLLPASLDRGRPARPPPISGRFVGVGSTRRGRAVGQPRAKDPP